MRHVATFVLACLTGCATAYTPAQLVSEGKIRTLDSQLPPAQAAGCIARSQEDASSALEANVRATGTSYEILVRAPVVRTASLMVVVRVDQSGTGSRATFYFIPEHSDTTIDTVVARAKGC